MTLGDGILWSTALFLLAAGIYTLSVRKKWKTFGKVIAALILIGVVIGGGVWAWDKWDSRPYVVEEYHDIKLGMKRVDVTLLKGQPDPKYSGEIDINEETGRYSLLWVFDYSNDYRGVSFLVVVFSGGSKDDLTVGRVCKEGGSDYLLGFGRYNTERDVIKKLGEPSEVSVNVEGTSKWINYEQWNVSYEITKNKVGSRCMNTSPMSYDDEYGIDPKLTEMTGLELQRARAIARAKARLKLKEAEQQEERTMTGPLTEEEELEKLEFQLRLEREKESEKEEFQLR